jgi:hypothetical protein
LSTPTTKQEFKDFILRKLGHPTINIEVTEEQLDDRVDEALEYFYDYHFSGSIKEYFKHLVVANNKSDVVYDCNVVSGGTLYANSDNVVFTTSGPGSNAAATLTTDDNGVITTVTLTDNGDAYAEAPTVTIDSGTGSGANITCQLGGWIPLPENIIGGIKVFPVGQSLSTNDIFNIRYQIALNDLYTLTHSSITPYYSAFQHVNLLEEILVGNQPVRFNRHQDRIYIDMDWTVVTTNTYLIIEAYKIVDPNVWADGWSDRWLQRYATALVKEQWGNHLTKYRGMQLPGGIEFNGDQIYADAVQERKELETELVHTYSVPAMDMIGALGTLCINTSLGLLLLKGFIDVWNNIPMV